jgi:branched-subunit amino acid transport protein
MSNIEIWGVIAILTLATIITRCIVFMYPNSIKLPTKVRHALKYAPAAALAAVILPDLFYNSSGAFDLGLNNPKLLAGIIALAFCYFTRRMLGTIVLGMAVFTVLRLMFA